MLLKIYIQVPIFDGSAGEWVDAIEKVGLRLAVDQCGNCCEKMAPSVNEPVHVWRNDCFLVAFPAEAVRITYGIDFPQVQIFCLEWLFIACFWSENVASIYLFLNLFCVNLSVLVSYNKSNYPRNLSLQPVWFFDTATKSLTEIKKGP